LSAGGSGRIDRHIAEHLLRAHGVERVLAELAQRPGVTQGLLTGNNMCEAGVKLVPFNV
jgi:hypothetical protein